MKFVIPLMLIVCVVDVKPLASEVADILFKKYAVMKICEDCYGKETVNMMLAEVGLAYAKCRGKPSFLPILEQVMSSSTSAPIAPVEEPQPTESDQPVKISPQLSQAKPPAFAYIQNLPQPYYVYPNPFPYHQRYSPYPSFYNAGPLNPDYRWKRSDEDLTPPMPELAIDERQREAELPAETDDGALPEPMATENQAPTSEPFSFGTYLANKYVSKHKNLITNMTCVLKEMKFVDDDMQPNYDSIRNRINRLPVADSLKKDLFDGIEMCKQFSSCIPSTPYSKNQMISNLVKPYAFFKCFKGRKIEACMKKDLREKFGGLLTGLSATSEMMGGSRSLNGYDRSLDGEDNLGSIFNMVYGFDIDAVSNSFF